MDMDPIRTRLNKIPIAGLTAGSRGRLGPMPPPPAPIQATPTDLMPEAPAPAPAEGGDWRDAVGRALLGASRGIAATPEARPGVSPLAAGLVGGIHAAGQGYQDVVSRRLEGDKQAYEMGKFGKEEAIREANRVKNDEREQVNRIKAIGERGIEQRKTYETTTKAEKDKMAQNGLSVQEQESVRKEVDKIHNPSMIALEEDSGRKAAMMAERDKAMQVAIDNAIAVRKTGKRKQSSETTLPATDSKGRPALGSIF